MPKKKKSKEDSETEFVFDYRYTPKPYFTAPASPANNEVSSANTQYQQKLHVPGAMNPNPALVKDRDRLAQNKNSTTSLVNSWPTAGQASGKFNTPKNSSSALARSSVDPTRSQFGLYDIASSISKEPVFPGDQHLKNETDSDRSKMQDMFTDMYRGKIDPAVIEIVLSEANWDENQALDALSQLVPHDEAHASQSRDDCLGIGSLTPDRNLTPTAPTLSYCSSMTSLDEFGLEYCRNLADKNVSGAADALRTDNDYYNDLDRQRRALSRGSTPRNVLKGGGFAVKNISLGSTESLESNRSLEPSTLLYKSASLSRTTTPKKTNFDKASSLLDISKMADNGVALSLPKERYEQDIDSSRSDPGRMPVCIPLQYGDIVLEHGYQQEASDKLLIQSEQKESNSKEPLSDSITSSNSISDYSNAITTLTSRLNGDPKKLDGQTSFEGSTAPELQSRLKESTALSDTASVGLPTSSHRDGSTETSLSTNDQSTESSGSDAQEKRYQYNGILGSGSTVPTPLLAARPKTSTIDRLREIARSEDKVMFILRGVPGSGKSTLARSLVEDSSHIFCSDNFFTKEDGRYVWEGNRLQEAHAWNQQQVCSAAEQGLSPIVADNTNTQAWEMEPYVKICLMHGYRPVIAEPSTPWKNKARELEKRNVHGVQYDKIKQMLDRFQHDVTVDQLISSVVSKNPALAQMAERLRSEGSTKLSRKKLASKTMKRNRLDDTVEKFKDKTVDSKEDNEEIDDDTQCETEIKYPSKAAMNGLSRKPTIKINNCEPNILKSSSVASSIDNLTVELLDSLSLKSEVSEEVTNCVVSPSQESMPSAAAELNAGKPELSVDNQPAAGEISEAVSQTPSLDLGKPYSNGISSLLKLSSQTEQSLAQTPLIADKIKKSARQSKAKKAPLLNVDPNERDRWLKNDWGLPAYPSQKESTDVAGSALYPPPYDESPGLPPYENAQESVSMSAAVKTRDEYTLTEPGDYAAAYKAMQYNTELPEGWIMITGRSTAPFLKQQTAKPRVNITFDKGTTIEGDDIGGLDSEGNRKDRDEQINRLHACFPQLKKSQLADVLDLCHGDGNWAMNLLLDSNSLKVPKPKKKKKCGGLRLPDHKKLKLKVLSKGKTIGRALQSCLGDGQPAYSYQRLSKETADITFSPELITELYNIYGEDSETTTMMESGPMKVTLPKWIVHRMYRCLMESINAQKDTDNKFEKVLPNHDEALARRLQLEDEILKSSASVPKSLNDIMDEELANSFNDCSGSHSEENIAVKIKKQKLYQRYPGSDRSFLDNVFQAYSYNLEETIKELDEHFRQPGNASQPAVDTLICLPTTNSRESTPKRELFPETSANADDGLWQDVEVPAQHSYDHYRAEAHLYQKLRKECYHKSQMAKEKKMYLVATYYAEQAKLHDKRMKEAHWRAARCIFTDNNRLRSLDTIDLHGLHVDELPTILERLVEYKRAEGKVTHLSLITGKGNHSKGGVSKLRQPVETFLRQNNMSFTWINPGMVRMKL